MTRVLITGGSGFLGTNLVQYYLNRNTDVVNWDIRTPRNPAHHPYWQNIDVLDIDSVRDAIGKFKPDYVFHMAAKTDLNGVDEDSYKANTDGVRNIMLAAETTSNLKRIIFASSMLVCELGYQPANEWDVNPITLYGESKVVGEKIVREAGQHIIPWIIVRPTSIWGPWFDVPYKQFFDTIRKGLYFHPKGVSVQRSYGFVLNTVHQLGQLATCERRLVQSKTFYLADYEPLELRQWAQMIQEAMGARPIHDVPPIVLKCAAKAGDLLKKFGVKNVPMTSFRLRNMRTDSVFDMESLAKICEKLPYNAERGVQMTVQWMIEFKKRTEIERH